jgi:hypothetical protein
MGEWPRQRASAEQLNIDEATVLAKAWLLVSSDWCISNVWKVSHGVYDIPPALEAVDLVPYIHHH